MRDRWFDRIGAMRRNLEERGFLATLYYWGDVFRMRFDLVHEVFGEGWIVVAEELKKCGYIDMEIEDARVTISIHFTDGSRRSKNRINQRKHRERRKNGQEE